MISKYAPKRIDFLINENDIFEEKRLIKGTDEYFITSSGVIYRKYNDKYYKIKPHCNTRNGYLYVKLVMSDGKQKTFRLHRLVALAYLPNPNNYPIVGHKNNIKTDCRVSNLYWTTNKENIQKAIDDKLLINAKGYEDSQSMPVIVFNKEHVKIDQCGSISECSKKYHISKSTVARHCNHEIKGKTRCGYYFEFQSIKSLTTIENHNEK